MVTKSKNSLTNNIDVNSSCEICNGNISNNLIDYNDIGLNHYGGLFQNLKLCFCNKCGLSFSLPIIDNDLIFDFYKYQYRSKTSTFHIDFENLKDIHETFVDYSHKTTQQLVLIDDYCTFNKNDIFLDIGPGTGASFYIASSLLKQPQLYGIEISNGASAFYNRFPLDKINILESLDEFITLNNKAKVILMSHCLEHYQLKDLPKLFEDIKKSLDSNGLLIIEVPNVDLRIHANFRGVDTPHFLFFSQDSLCKLLEKYGFELMFQNTCNELYETESSYDTNNNSKLKIKLKMLLRHPFNKMPPFFQIYFRKIILFFQRKKWKSHQTFNHRNIEVNSRHKDEDIYGGNRKCIRLVAKLSA
tara:strand:- start:164 stop:1240 length:1077 start_codon:yes stop_codon:yes gene_type:complete